MTQRIVQIIPTMDRGGAEKQLCLLAAGLPRDQFDVHVVLLTRDGPRSEQLRHAGIPVTVIGKRFKADPSALFRLRKHLTQLNPDIVHTWLFAANSFGRAAAKWAGVRRIIASERCVDPWKTSSHFWIDRQLAKCTDAITTNSVGVRDFYANHGIDPNLFRIIPNGIPPRSKSKISRQEAFARLKVDPERKLILAVGRLWPQKRYRDLIWAAEMTATVREDTTLVIIGEGPQSGELLRHRDAVTAPSRVRFAGQRNDVADLLPHADVFWIGSEYEGQSNSVIEAMQAGVPVVASDIPGNRDLIVDQECGFLVEMGDTADFARRTLTLLANPELADRLGQAAKQRIDTKFTVANMIAAHQSLYQE
ncbi:N-acetylgalactosamine-N,N'-diacetylbacillosaminyl-diphospho-undecaprenol 4-alpha-N-acetylgalactosaminyltransferase [Rubripirellula lacrimiformis]|uniref:N-acetylgalactosamine-N, N'-diacetylbacillosaminyl-diphospho-undecaprenol 4-alpha-N-acetylgalactosaminyltransferase n=1 Tax=Rubripirellula lacrimiformis TaxID=1930273 RepID=A0A517NCD0_9BACT|nr:glycosyltransferase [Rubripirellula lacrimiformis]QDT04787.1 N-acetylgalactosamine-N,N'-diacetylbacillosaminyl-diphospho-undecaprenol 4-alpha-N-acetylgalactosaminyltransferase [Rubripirellula lacrimiformis]